MSVIILDIGGNFTIRTTEGVACSCDAVHALDCDALQPGTPGQVIHIHARDREKPPRPWRMVARRRRGH